MDIQLIGTIVRVFPLASGVKRDGGEWQKQEYLLSVEGDNFPKNVCFQVFGEEKIKELGLQENERVRVHLEIQSREYNGRYYTHIDCWRVDRNNDAQPTPPKEKAEQAQQLEATQQQTQKQESDNKQNQAPQATPQIENNDLPF